MEILSKDNIKEYEEFNQNCPKGHFTQSFMWAGVKDNWTHKVIVSRDNDGKIKGAMSVLIRPVPVFKCTLMYSPRGPVCDVHDKETLADLLEGAKQLAKEHKSYVLKMDPDVEIADAEFTDIMKELGCRIQPAGKNFEGIQPRFVFRLYFNGRYGTDIAGSDENDVIMMFGTETRRKVRYALKHGVEVTVGTRDELKEFHKIMVETGIRDQFVVRNLEYFEKMYDCFGENLRLYVARYEGEIIAGTVAIKYGDKVWYLYGASSNENRKVMPNYLLQWEMIKWAAESGCRLYDFRGVSGDLDESNPLYGLYRFKKGFNGDFTEFIGDIDYVFNPFMFKLVGKTELIYRELRRRIMLFGKK